ncbi:hypothetical protein BAS06_04360 [Elizabethkingia miricola]|uniref:restriction endonuclease subunit S n=1 Tax=Elizabethkingia miricola TaxID=172045 RepID=UPI000999BB77|nr:restriction endonuclease subunit S [Elizabethkingia miricola]OPB89597.1 hypothetical protein BAS06_04360 [Elizabethkingia miricola]
MIKGWKEVTLEDIIEYRRDKVQFNEVNSSNFISADNMLPEIGGITKSDYIPQKGNVSKFEKQNILVSNIRPYFKKMWFATFDGGCSNDVFVIKRKVEELDTKFLFYNLCQQEFFDFMMAGANGTKMPRGNKNAIIKYKVNLPPLKTQRKIVSILSGYDNLIENNQKRIKILEEMVQQTYEEWFVRMHFPGYETAVFGKDGLPEGWEVKSLGELTETMQYGYTESANSQPVGPKFLRITDIVGSNINWQTVPYCVIDEKKKAKYLLKEGDIVIARTGATVGYAKRINKNCPNAVFASYLIRLKLKPEIDDVFMGVFVESHSFVQTVQNIAGGAAQPNANAPILKQIEIIVPSKNIQDNFREIVLKQKNAQELLLKQNQHLREARDILLPRLMMGIIDVESLETKQNEAKIIPLAQPKKEASKEFKEAVLIACLTERFGSEKFPLGRKRYTKLSYLFHRYSDNKIQDYLRKAAGPYNPKTKYGGPEKIALNSKYIQNWKGDKGTTGFVVAEKIDDAKKYFSNYWQIADLDWLVTEFKFKSNDELELLATVDNSLVELSKKNLELTPTNVLDIIKSEKEWEAKLERTIFSDANVERAIMSLCEILKY